MEHLRHSAVWLSRHRHAHRATRTLHARAGRVPRHSRRVCVPCARARARARVRVCSCARTSRHSFRTAPRALLLHKSQRSRVPIRADATNLSSCITTISAGVINRSRLETCGMGSARCSYSNLNPVPQPCLNAGSVSSQFPSARSSEPRVFGALKHQAAPRVHAPCIRPAFKHRAAVPSPCRRLGTNAAVYDNTNPSGSDCAQIGPVTLPSAARALFPWEVARRRARSPPP